MTATTHRADNVREAAAQSLGASKRALRLEDGGAIDFPTGTGFHGELGTNHHRDRPSYDISSLSPGIGEHRDIPEGQLARRLNELLPGIVAYHRSGGCKPQWIVPDCLIYDHADTRTEPCHNNAGERIGTTEVTGPILVNVDCHNGGDPSRTPAEAPIHATMEWTMTREDHGTQDRRERFIVRGPAGALGDAIVARLRRDYHPEPKK